MKIYRIANDKIYLVAASYFDVGHSKDPGPIVLWVIDSMGNFLSKKIEKYDKIIAHDDFFGEYTLLKALAQGRYVVRNNITSGMMGKENDTPTNKRFCENILKEKFGSSVKIYW